MAKINSNKQFSGMIGNLVFRTLNSEQIVQSAPDKVKQSIRTKMSGSEFRQCSKWGRSLRTMLHDFLTRQTDSYMHRRLTTALYHTILDNTQLPKGERTPLNCDMKAMMGFEFNTHSPLSHHLQMPFEISLQEDGRVLVSIPSFKPGEIVHFPKHFYDVDLMVYIFAITQIEPFKMEHASHFVMTVPKNNDMTEPQTFQTETPMPAGAWVLAVAKLQFFTHNAFVGKKYENNAQMSPTQIVFSGRG